MPRQHTYKARSTAKAPTEVEQAPFREERFTWKPEDITISYPTPVAAAGALDSELHTVLWSLEHVTNQATFSDAMVGVAGYLAEHPTDQLVRAAIARVEARLEHAT